MQPNVPVLARSGEQVSLNNRLLGLFVPTLIPLNSHICFPRFTQGLRNNFPQPLKVFVCETFLLTGNQDVIRVHLHYVCDINQKRSKRLLYPLRELVASDFYLWRWKIAHEQT